MKIFILFALAVTGLSAADIVLLGFDEKGALTNFVLRGDGFSIAPPGTNPRIRVITVNKPLTVQVPLQFSKVETYDVSEQHNIFVLANNPVAGKTSLMYTSASGVSTPLAISFYVGKYISTFVTDNLSRPGKVTVSYFTEDLQ